MLMHLSYSHSICEHSEVSFALLMPPIASSSYLTVFIFIQTMDISFWINIWGILQQKPVFNGETMNELFNKTRI